MIITEKFDPSAAAELFMRICAEDDVFYKPLSLPSFIAKFFGPGKVTLAALSDDLRLIGFASGTAIPSAATSYLSFVGVEKSYRRRGIGRALVSALEDALRFPGLEKFDIVFHNPVGLEWFIPGGNGDDHPYAPGVDLLTAAHPFFLALGYDDFVVQLSFYRRLAGYTMPDGIEETARRLAAEGISVTLYDPARHRGLYELFDDIGNPGWRKTVMENLDKPIVVAVDEKRDGLVVAYNGPLTLQPSGRGNFCGIGTIGAYRGRGIGKLVFCEMCRRHHEETGATFMSLYTGENNNARRIYSAAGFDVVRRWADMRKPIRDRGAHV